MEKNEPAMVLKIGKYSMAEHYRSMQGVNVTNSVYIYNDDGEGGEFKIEKLEKLIDKLFSEEL